MRDFGNAGINLYAVMPSNSFNTLGEPYCKFKPFWVWDETYLWNVVDEQFALVIRQNQNAKFNAVIEEIKSIVCSAVSPKLYEKNKKPPGTTTESF